MATFHSQHSTFHHISEITGSLFLTSAYGVNSPTALRAKGITCIINITLSFQSPTPKMRDMEFVRIAVDDIPTAQLGVHFDRIADKIHAVKKNGGKTVVHCYAGRSRSASAVIAYLMKYEHMSLKQAHSHVRSRRAVIRPNPGFWKQLITYEHRLYGKNSVKMIYTPAGAIPDIYAHEMKNFVPL
ncbi:dual specificity protein phosphatase 14-like [Diadema antillarum]|uniref:dual specificity protein phosphatase 14-like n=1 Tax=Diadema antillarum TaxID=105358 RepID=UPI003A8ABE58